MQMLIQIQILRLILVLCVTKFLKYKSTITTISTQHDNKYYE